jgi:hypothetical protein
MQRRTKNTILRILIIILFFTPCLIIGFFISIPKIFLHFIMKYSNDFKDYYLEKLTKLQVK